MKLVQLCVPLLVLTGMLHGQVTTATFHGIVADSSGARIPGAKVTFLHEGTASMSQKTVDAAGEFTFDFLRVGSYTIRIEAPGFKTYTATETELAAGQTVRRTFEMSQIFL